MNRSSKNVLFGVWMPLFLAVASSSVRAGGATGVGGGGDVLVLADDTIVLADPYIQHAGENFELNPILVAELRRVGNLLASYGADASGSTGAVFIDRDVINPLIDYRFKEDLPQDCHRITTDPSTLPLGSTKILAACTVGNVTTIRPSIFNGMSVREQAKLIVHERLRALEWPISDEYIADVTSGIGVQLDLFNDHRAKNFREATREERFALELLRKRLIQTHLNTKMRTFYGFTLTRFGGLVGLPYDTSEAMQKYVADGATIGLGASLDLRFMRPDGLIEKLNGLSIYGSTFANWGSTVLPKISGNIHIWGSDFIGTPPRLSAGTSIVDSTISCEIWMGENSSIENSRIGTFVHLHSGAGIADSNLPSGEGYESYSVLLKKQAKLTGFRPETVKGINQDWKDTLAILSIPTLVGFLIAEPLLHQTSSPELVIPRDVRLDLSDAEWTGECRNLTIRGLRRLSSAEKLLKLCEKRE